MMQPRRNKFRRFLGAPRRLARRRGFGIHSPFAFDFVRRVVAPYYGYYCYPALSALARRSNYSSKQLRLLFRIALFFRPLAFRVIGPDAEIIAKAVHAGSPGAVHAAETPQLVVIGGEAGASQIAGIIGDEVVVVVFDRRKNSAVLKTIFDSARFGMMFRGSSTAIFVGRRHLPHQIFNVWI